MPKTEEFSEVVPGNPEVLWDAVKDHHEWVPLTVAHLYKGGEFQEGEGDKRSVVHYHLHDDHHDNHGGASKVTVDIEEYNKSDLSYVCDYHGDPRYSPLKFHVRFLPGPSPGTSYVKWVIEYHPRQPGLGPPKEIIDYNLGRTLFSDLAAHLESVKGGSEPRVTDSLEEPV